MTTDTQHGPTWSATVDPLLDKISDLLKTISRLEQENAYLSAELLSCRES